MAKKIYTTGTDNFTAGQEPVTYEDETGIFYYDQFDQALINEFEDVSGRKFDSNGPVPDYCEHCGALFQYIPDHDCAGFRIAGRAAAATDYQHYT